jgi:hypothetical protein
MRESRAQRTNAPAPSHRREISLPSSGFALIVDGQAKSEFKALDQAMNAARDLKARFPKLQIKVYDAEKGLDEEVALAAA